MKIISLESENFMKLRAVTIVPHDNVVVIGGNNEQGKSSTIRSITAALGGAKEAPPEPIRKGETKSRIVLDLGEVVVKQTYFYNKEGELDSNLVVTNADGAPIKRPREYLATLYSSVAFDPMAFANMKKQEQVEALKKALGLDFTALDQQRQTLYEKRSEWNRALKSANERATSYPISVVNAPNEQIDVADAMERLGEMQMRNASRASIARKLNELDDRIKDYEGALLALKQNREVCDKELSQAGDMEDSMDLEEKIKSSQSINALVVKKQERAKEIAKAHEAEKKAVELDHAIKAIDDQKRQSIENASWPIPGLGFSEDGVLYEGLPLEQASQARRLLVSMAIGSAMNPKLRVMCSTNAAYLDNEKMELIRKFAEEHDMQVWLERVGDKDPGAVIIEDGEVR